MYRQAYSLIIIFFLSFACQALAADWLYNFRPGDTIWDLCKKYTNEPNCWLNLGPYNDITKDRLIRPGTVIRIPTAWLKNPPEPVVVGYAHGQSNYITSVNGQSLKITTGLKLYMGTTIKTADGSVNLIFADGSQLQLEPNSELKLDRLSNFQNTGMVDSSVRLNKGAVKTRIIKRDPTSRFRIETPAAVAAVRGTEFRVSSSGIDSSEMLAEVLEGVIEVRAQNQSQSVPMGFGVVTRQGEAPQTPRKLLPKPVFLNSDSNLYLPVSIQWKPIAEATHYQLDFMVTGTKEQLLRRYTTSDSRIALEDVSEGCYRLRLNGIDNVGLHGLPGYQNVCLSNVPEVRLETPLLLAENLQKNDENGVSLSWPAAGGAVSYRVEVSPRADFDSQLKVIDTSLNSITLSAGESFYLRTQSVNARGDLSGFSDTVRWESEDYQWLALIPLILFTIAIL